MTIDGTGDDAIKIQGVREYSFTDADAGGIGSGSDVDEVDDGTDIDERKDISDDDEDNGSAVYTSEEEEEDDTAEIDKAAAAAITAAVAPAGFEIISGEPALGSLREENELIGSLVLFKWDGDPVAAGDFGWYCGKVTKRATDTDKRKSPGVNFQVKFCNAETRGVLPGCLGTMAKNRFQQLRTSILHLVCAT